MKKSRKKQWTAIVLIAALCLSVVMYAPFGGEDAVQGTVLEPAALAADGSSSFADIENHWARASIDTAVSNGWFGGTSATTFSPDAAVSRGMFVTILARMADADTSTAQNVFRDVADDAYYAPSVAWAYENGITSGTTADTFSPDRAVSREQLATLLYNFAAFQNETLPTGTSRQFADDGQISSWAAEAVDALTAANVISGRSDNRFDPSSTASRAEAAAMLVRYGQAINGIVTSAPVEGPTILTNGGYPVAISALTHQSSSGNHPDVYFTDDITPAGLMEVYNAMNWTPTGNVAVKLSTGEPPASNYLDPNLIRNLVQSVDGTIVECNTAYGGSRSGTAMHLQVAADHGFTAIANVDILDADGSMSLPVAGGTHLTENLVGSHFANYDSYLVLSHFKGHAMAGFGGAIKNISIGLGSAEGKCLIHTAGASNTNPWGGDQDAFLESMGEAGKSVSDSLNHGDNIVYVSVMNRLSVDCDCDGNPAEPDMHDIGVLASTDPVALDQACIDFVYAQRDGDAASLVQRIESRNGLHTLEHAEDIGLGSRTYTIVDLGA